MKVLLAMLLALSMLAAACGDDSSDSSSGSDDSGSDDSGSDDSGSDDSGSDDSDDSGSDDSGSDDSGSDDSGDGGEIATDHGVDVDNKVIRVGLNADLSGPFASLVAEIVASQEVYWEVFNENGGYQGWTVETVVLDSGYATDVGIQNYEELAQEGSDGVLMITENTGSPITSAIAEQAADDDLLVIPLSWASLWPDPEFGSSILEKGTTYCIEAMNATEWLYGYVQEQGLEPSLAIVTRPGEYGEDGAAGAALAAEALGINVVYDGTSAVAGDDRTAIVAEILGSGATMVFTTLTPGETIDIFGNAVSQGFEGYWTGSSPSFNYLFHMSSDFAQAFDDYWFHSGYYTPWGTAGSEGMEQIVAEMSARRPELNISDVYTVGWQEGLMAETLIRAAIDGGDLTRANMVAISQDPSFSVDFLGLSANQSWPADYNDAVVRGSYIYDVSLPAFNIISTGESTPDNLGSSGMLVLEADYTGSVAENFVFDGPCIEPSG
ncbi:MAG: ABC transporter substrate-binding protein [Acidimicrobiaceae bacterium]|jgi:ABC-type branched-subunit amino acid transport system substrate-binding protein|nr:ABC transporter substrate-binding protein [Acidimicrobiaceae bacterium]